MSDGEWDPEAEPIRPTVTEDGIRHNVPQPDPSDPGDDKPNTDPADEKDQNKVLIVMLIVLGVAILVAAGTGVVMYRLAKSKKNDKKQD